MVSCQTGAQRADHLYFSFQLKSRFKILLRYSYQIYFHGCEGRNGNLHFVEALFDMLMMNVGCLDERKIVPPPLSYLPCSSNNDLCHGALIDVIVQFEMIGFRRYGGYDGKRLAEPLRMPLFS